MNHTPTPWAVDALGYIRGPNSENILEVKENAEFVCLAINSHEELLESLKKLISRFDDGTIVRDISKDSHGDYTMRMMEFIMELNNAKAAIAKAEVK